MRAAVQRAEEALQFVQAQVARCTAACLLSPLLPRLTAHVLLHALASGIKHSCLAVCAQAEPDTKTLETMRKFSEQYARRWGAPLAVPLRTRCCVTFTHPLPGQQAAAV